VLKLWKTGVEIGDEAMNFINRYKIALIGIVSSILLIFNVVMINLIVGIYPVSIDMTGNKLYSTGTTTLKILKKLKEDVVIYENYVILIGSQISTKEGYYSKIKGK
jgi:hypothetical protein